MLSRNAIFTIHAKGSIHNPLKNLVGTTGFEPATTCPPDKYENSFYRFLPFWKFDKKLNNHNIIKNHCPKLCDKVQLNTINLLSRMLSRKKAAK